MPSNRQARRREKRRPSAQAPAAALLALLVAAPAAGQSPGGWVMVPVIQVQPVYLLPVIPVVPMVQVQPMIAAPPAVAQPVVGFATPAPADPPGNMLSRLIADIEIKNDVGIGDGPEGPLGIADYRRPPEPPAMVAVPVALVPAGPMVQGVYTVRSGGSLAAVANRTGARLEDLIALNPGLPANQRLAAGVNVNLPFPWPR